MESVTYIGPDNVGSADLQPYVQQPELVPAKVEVGSHDTIQKSIEKLFELESEKSFAAFAPPPSFSLKNLFREQAIPGLDIKQAISLFDEMFDGKEFSEDEKNKQQYVLFALFYQILELNELVEEIRLRLIALLKS